MKPTATRFSHLLCVYSRTLRRSDRPPLRALLVKIWITANYVSPRASETYSSTRLLRVSLSLLCTQRANLAIVLRLTRTRDGAITRCTRTHVPSASCSARSLPIHPIEPTRLVQLSLQPPRLINVRRTSTLAKVINLYALREPSHRRHPSNFRQRNSRVTLANGDDREVSPTATLWFSIRFHSVVAPVWA